MPGILIGFTRSSRNIGIAAALFDRINDVLLSGPHHNACCPKLNCQFLRFSEAYASIGRTRLAVPLIRFQPNGSPSAAAMACCACGL